jgi:hypothetical protein
MKSPFPGMDPYLEQHWRDVHSRLVVYTCDHLQSSLPQDLFVRVEERVHIENDETKERSTYPDVRVIELVDETFLEIREARSGNRLVTLIEFMSVPIKAPGDAREQYLQKRKELLLSYVSLVEIDLLRAGNRVSGIPFDRIAARMRAPYQMLVRRAWQGNLADFYPVPVHQRLPYIRIPLRASDEDVPLDLQALVDQCYLNGRYQTINYQVDPDPPLTGGDAAWADALLRAAGKRT